jgi:hypothetical protein
MAKKSIITAWAAGEGQPILPSHLGGDGSRRRPYHASAVFPSSESGLRMVERPSRGLREASAVDLSARRTPAVQ